VLPYAVSFAGLECLCGMAKNKRRLLEELRQRKQSCAQSMADAALEAFGFTRGRSQGHAQVWAYKHITITVHAPHGGKDMDPGAVAMVIRKIVEADLFQQAEAKKEKQKDAH